MKDFITLGELKEKEIKKLIDDAFTLKGFPEQYRSAMRNKNLLMIFEAPSLRTRISFEVAMNHLGGHPIFYTLKESTLGKKETMYDLAKTVSRYADLITARIYSHDQLLELAQYATIPVINAMTNMYHPCQVLGDLMTIKEKKKKLKGLKLAYFGDANNNVTHSLLFGTALTGINMSIACPQKKEYLPNPAVLKKAEKIAKRNKAQITITSSPAKAAKGADIIYTDTWMSYHIPEKEKTRRVKDLKPYQVNKKIMPKNALFMHCMPIGHGYEVTENILKSKNCIIFDQAENRLHCQKAIILNLLGLM